MTMINDYFKNMISDEERERLPYLETLPMLLEKCSKDYGETIALSDDRMTLTYQELPDHIGKRIKLLEDYNIPSDVHVAVICRNKFNKFVRRCSVVFIVGIYVGFFVLNVLPETALNIVSGLCFADKIPIHLFKSFHAFLGNNVLRMQTINR